ncbi:MAG TPA: hypothetical protein VHB20_18465 [Verrucomicrobiae bacterium]|jgi:hypothetical protein|nr:hypothetical protein [Verrucomicrobiae bacterium]
MARRRQSLSDILLVWGFVLSFFALFGVACVEAFKIVAHVPSAFQSGLSLRNPMNASDADNQGPQAHMTPQQRAQYGASVAGQPAR